MTVSLVMMARDEAPIIRRAIESALPLIDTWTLLDTGSTDDTPKIAQEALSGLPGQVVAAPWAGFAEGRTAALRAARWTADWLLLLDADQTVEIHEGLRAWLATDPDPTTDVWQVATEEAGTTWLMPRLTRGSLDWTYEGVTHEWLATDRKQRVLLGLTITHHADGASRAAKHERDLELLAPGVAAGDARSVYYTAQALQCLGSLGAAVAMYERRAAMPNTWEEEAWHAEYMAALLLRDVPGLMAAWRRRPWRHEPLTAAAAIVKGDGARDDVLFLEA